MSQQPSKNNRDSKSSRISFVPNEHGESAGLLNNEHGGNSNDGHSINSRSDGAQSGTHFTEVGEKSGSTSNQSSVTRRPRSRTFLAEQRDIQMQQEEVEKSFCQRYKKVFLLIPYIMMQGIAGMCIRPLIPEIMKDAFGSDKRAAEITSYIAAATAFVGMFTCTFYGKLLDTIGRKPFFVIAPLFQQAIPMLLLVIFRSKPEFYMIAGAVGSLIQGSYMTSYVADNFSTKTRVRIFAIITAVGNMTAFAAIIVGALPETVCIALGCALAFGNVVYSICFLSESLPEDVKQPFSKEIFGENPFSAMQFLLKSNVAKAIIGIVACFLFAQVGTGDIYMYYLNERVGFNKSDNAYLFMIDGVLSPICMLIVLPFLAKRLSPTMIVFISLIALMIELILIATIWAKWPVFVLVVPLVVVTTMMVPILLTVLTNSGNPADQGRRLTGFAAITDLCDAFGPLVFGSIYGNVSGTLVVLPFIIAAILIIPAGFITFRLPILLQKETEQKEAAALEAQARGRSSSSINSLRRSDRQ